MFTGFLFLKNIQCHKFSTIFDSSTAYGSGNSAVFPTNIREPAPLGVDPEDAVMETSTRSFPFEILVL